MGIHGKNSKQNKSTDNMMTSLNGTIHGKHNNNILIIIQCKSYHISPVYVCNQIIQLLLNTSTDLELWVHIGLGMFAVQLK